MRWKDTNATVPRSEVSGKARPPLLEFPPTPKTELWGAVNRYKSDIDALAGKKGADLVVHCYLYRKLAACLDGISRMQDSSLQYREARSALLTATAAAIYGLRNVFIQGGSADAWFDDIVPTLRELSTHCGIEITTDAQRIRNSK